MRRIRVGVDASNLVSHRTGVGNYIYDIIFPLCETHKDVDWFLYSNASIQFPKFPNVVQRENVGKWRGVFWQNFELRGQMRRDRIDAYWGANGFIPVFGIDKIGSVLTIYDLVHHFSPKTQVPLVRWSRRLFQPISAWRADIVTCISDATANDASRIYHINKSVTIRPNIGKAFALPSAEAIAEVRQKYDLPERYIFLVGTLEPRKNVPAFLESVSRCRKDGFDLPMIVHAGGSGWLDDEIKSLVETAESAGVLKRLGYVPNEHLPALYGACTVFCMPSTYEGYGMPLTEAQLCGAPVMHGNHPAMCEASGGLGIAFEPSIDGMQLALQQLSSGTLGIACRLHSDVCSAHLDGSALIWQAITDVIASKNSPQLTAMRDNISSSKAIN